MSVLTRLYAVLPSVLIFVGCAHTKPVLKTATSLPYHSSKWGKVFYFSEYREISTIAKVGDELWAGTNHGLMGWNLQNGSFSVMTEEYGLSGNSVKLVASNGSQLWALTDKGMSGYKDGVWQSVSLPCPGAKCEINRMVVTEDGCVWVSTTSNRLLRHVFGSWVSLIYRGGPVMAMGALGKSSILVSDKDGVVYRCGAGKCTKYFSLDGIVTDIYSEQGTLWLTAGDLLFLIPRGGKTVYKYSLPMVARAIRPLRDGYVVLSSNHFYLMKRCSVSSGGHKLPRSDGAPCYAVSKLSTKFPQAVVDMESDGSTVYLGTRHVGIARFDGVTLQYYRGNELVAPNSYKSVVCKTGKCFLHAGLGLYEYMNHTFSEVRLGAGMKPLFLMKDAAGTPVTSVYDTSNSQLTFFGYSGSGHKWIRRSELTASYPEEPSIAMGAFTKSYIAWLGIRERGLVVARVFNFRKNRVSVPHQYRDARGREMKLVGPYTQMHVHRGHRYIISDDGLIHLWKDAQGKHYMKYGDGNGLDAEDVTGITFSGADAYVSTDNGVCVQHGMKGDFVCKSVLRGTSLVGITWCGHNIYAAGVDTIYRLSPDLSVAKRLKAYKDLLSPVITGISCTNGSLWVWHKDALSIIELKNTGY